jgi:hypothetical protein
MRECVFEASSASGARVQGRPTTGFLDDRLFLQASSSHCCVLCLADPRAHMAMLLKTPRSSATHTPPVTRNVSFSWASKPPGPSRTAGVARSLRPRLVEFSGEAACGESGTG